MCKKTYLSVYIITRFCGKRKEKSGGSGARRANFVRYCQPAQRKFVLFAENAALPPRPLPTPLTKNDRWDNKNQQGKANPYQITELTVEIHVWVPADDYMDHVGSVTNALWDTRTPFGNEAACTKVNQTVELNADNSFTLPTTINGRQVIQYLNGDPLSGAGYKFYKGGDTVTMKDVPVSTNGVAKIQAMVPDLYVAPVRDAIKKYYGITTTTPTTSRVHHLPEADRGTERRISGFAEVKQV